MTQLATYYKRAIANRQRNPLHQGWYKIKECNDYLKLCCDELPVIATFNARKKGPQSQHLQRCTGEDCHIWFNRLPIVVAQYMGADILAALDALGGDGVPSAVIIDIKERYTPRIRAIIKECESARRATLSSEKERIRAGVSEIANLTYRAQRLVKEILTEVEKHRSI